jgi:hypothetical protein
MLDTVKNYVEHIHIKPTIFNSSKTPYNVNTL